MKSSVINIKNNNHEKRTNFWSGNILLFFIFQILLWAQNPITMKRDANVLPLNCY